MKYGLGIKMLISFLIGGIAVLYKLKMCPKSNYREVNSIINIPRKFLFSFLTEAKNIPVYFTWITKLKEEDRRNISIGKRYSGIVNLPFLGQHDIKYKITEANDGHWVVLRPQAKSYFNTEIQLMVSSINNDVSNFKIKILYQRTSALFRYTVAPLLLYLTEQQLNRTVKSVRSMVSVKWKAWQLANPSMKTKDKNEEKLKKSGHKKKLDPKVVNKTTTSTNAKSNRPIQKWEL